MKQRKQAKLHEIAHTTGVLDSDKHNVTDGINEMF